MFSVTTPKRLRSRTAEFSDMLRLTPHERPPMPANLSPAEPDKPKRRLGFLSRKKTCSSLAAAAAASAPPLPTRNGLSISIPYVLCT
jgi:hypothetical protein